MITFLNTTGILDQAEIQRLTTMWRFDMQTGRGTKTFTADDGKIEVHTFVFDKSEPISINSFINANLNPGIGRCVSLNGPEKFILMKDGGWDRPLHDGDTVSMVPAVGFVIADDIVYVYLAIMVAMMTYCIYMIATMKTGEGSAQSNVYSLSHLQNEERPGQSIERQYGRLKRFPSYCIKPWAWYAMNKQNMYSSFCLGHGKFSIEEKGLEDTNINNYYGVDVEVIEPNRFAATFHNNVWTNSEVAGGIDLIAYNQGLNCGQDGAREDGGYVGPNGWTNWTTPYGADDGWTGWYTANKCGSRASRYYLDFEFNNGLGKTNKKGDTESYLVNWQYQYRSMVMGEDGSIIYGTPVSVALSKRKATSTPIRTTEVLDLVGAYQFRCRRITKMDDGLMTREAIQWTNLRAVLPDTTSFGNVTVVNFSAQAQNGLTDSASKRFYTIATAYSPVYDSETKTWTDTPNRNPIWAMCDVMHAPFGGNYPYSYLDLDQLSIWAKWCDDNEVYFDYCFSEEIDIWQALSRIANVLRASPIVPLNKLRIIRDEKVEIPSYIFTKENIVDDSLQIQYKGVTDDDFDGYSVEYTDERTWKTETVECVLPGYDGSNLKTVQAYGITDRTRAFRWGMLALSNELESRAAISFDTNVNGWLCLPGDCAYINHPLFRMATDGRILSATGNTLVLDRNVKLNTSYSNVLKIRSPKDGGTWQTVTVTYSNASSGDYHTLTASEAILTDGLPFDDPQSLPIFTLGVTTNFAKKVRITKIQNTERGASFEAFIDTDKRFAYDESYPDVDIPDVPPATIVSAPTNVKIWAYDPNLDGIPTDTRIHWTRIPDEPVGATYVVQYSTDGTNWTNVPDYFTYSSNIAYALVGSFVSGTYRARVAVEYSKRTWSWGYSEETFLPANLNQFIIVSSDNVIDTSYMASFDRYITSYFGV